MIRSGSETNASGQHLKGAIALLIVNPSHQNLGIGSALHNEALDYLTKSVRESLSKSNPVPKEGSLQFGSIFPRIFPGIPDGPEFDHVTEWVKRKGWKFSDKVNSTDLYRTLPAGKPVDVSALTKKALDAGVTFRSGKPEDDEGLYALQKEAFDTFTVSHSFVDGGRRLTQCAGLARCFPNVDQGRVPRRCLVCIRSRWFTHWRYHCRPSSCSGVQRS